MACLTQMRMTYPQPRDPPGERLPHRFCVGMNALSREKGQKTNNRGEQK